MLFLNTTQFKQIIFCARVAFWQAELVDMTLHACVPLVVPDERQTYLCYFYYTDTNQTMIINKLTKNIKLPFHLRSGNILLKGLIVNHHMALYPLCPLHWSIQVKDLSKVQLRRL